MTSARSASAVTKASWFKSAVSAISTSWALFFFPLFREFSAASILSNNASGGVHFASPHFDTPHTADSVGMTPGSLPAAGAGNVLNTRVTIAYS